WVPENGATRGSPQEPSRAWCDTKMLAVRLNGKKLSLTAKYAVLPSAVNVRRHCQRSSEMAPGAKISADAVAAARREVVGGSPASGGGEQAAAVTPAASASMREAPR